MSSIYGKNIKISIFGQSHSDAIGVSIDGLPSGFKIDFDELNMFMRRRRPGQNQYTSGRQEPDEPVFLSGLIDGVTCGAVLAAIIYNTDARPSDYDQLSDIPRPSHADYPAYIKYGESRDIRGGGAFSGRLTAPLCIAGGICLQLLQREGIRIAAHISQIGNISDQSFDPMHVNGRELSILKDAAFPVLDKEKGEKMCAAIENIKQKGDSLGGIVECIAVNVPAGIGEPMFEGMDNRLASILFGIPAVKGVEFGSGFSSTELLGSENNDAFTILDNTVRTCTNNHGGILGGITTGMPILIRVAFKPTPSISMEQRSISLSQREEVRLTVAGRHDPCIVPRAVACVEAAAAVAIYDALQDSHRQMV